MSEQGTIQPVPLNSVWLAKDGRRMRVTEVVPTPFAEGGWWAKLDVLPPYAPRQRRYTSQAAVNFANGFLTKEAMDGR